MGETSEGTEATPVADQTQVTAARAGAEAWNAWRLANPDAPINLIGADLDFAILASANLTDADLTNAKLTFADLTGATLVGACLNGAVLTNANLTKAKLFGVDLTLAVLTSANLTEADLTGANVRKASLNDADLREVKRIRFDRNEIRGTRFTAHPGHPWRNAVRRPRRWLFEPADTDDWWSLLRRNYTGTNAVVGLLALLAFMLPHLITAVGLYLLSESQRVAGETDSDLTATHFVWQVALGVHRGAWAAWLWAALVVLLFVYNAGRFWLTVRVAPLLNAEIRSAVTPALSDYQGLCRAHRWLKCLAVPATVLFLNNLVQLIWWFLTEPITVLDVDRMGVG